MCVSVCWSNIDVVPIRKLKDKEKVNITVIFVWREGKEGVSEGGERERHSPISLLPMMTRLSYYFCGENPLGIPRY